MMDVKCYLHKDGTNDNREQCDDKTPSESRDPTKLSYIMDSLCNRQLRTDSVSPGVHLSWMTMVCGWGRSSGEWKQCQSGCQEMWEMPYKMHWIASRQGLRFDRATTEAALFTLRWSHKNHRLPKLTAKIRVSDGPAWFTKEAIRWLAVLIEMHRMFKEHHNQCMKYSRAAKATLVTIMKVYRVGPECVRSLKMACVWAVALDGSECWCDLIEVDVRDDLQLLLNWQAKSILAALPMTPQRVLLWEAGLTPTPVILDCRQQWFTAGLANA